MVCPALEHIRIILVEPAGALNVGAAARVMANMGLTRLVVVKPRCEVLGEEARRMAVHAGGILEQAWIVETLPEALTGCVRAIATTARERELNTPLELPDAALPWLLQSAAGGEATALIFGPEDRGLSNEELNYAQRFVRIPSDPDYPSLNLAQAIALCCYDLRRATQVQPQLVKQEAEQVRSDPRAALEKMEGFFQHLESILLKIGYLYPHTAASRMEKFRRFFLRAAPDEQELAMLRGIFRQMEWALTQPSNGAPTTDSEVPPQNESNC
jgi:tRNA/rRNA methyltransferase